MSRDRRRLLVNRIAGGVVLLMAASALLPLSLVLIYTVVRGLPAVVHPEFFIHVERPVGIPGAGVAHAIVGTIMMVGVASLMAIPVGVIAGVQLAEYPKGQIPDAVRLAADVLVGTPSIAIGLFMYALLVAPFHHFSALAGSAALAVLMLPVVARTTEGAIGLVPGSLREAGLALGLARWRVALQLILPAAVPGVVTGCLLAVARAAGETAPLLFTSLGSSFFNVNPTVQTQALPLVVFHYAQQPYDELVQQAWGAALILILLTLLINVASRLVLRRQIALAGGL